MFIFVRVADVYKRQSELGTKAELESLCKEAENYGIKVIVDVVANHLAGDHSRIEDLSLIHI